MQIILRQMVDGLGLGLLFALVLNAPIFYAIYRVHRLRQAYKAAAEEPFRELPLRPAGESLRIRIDELAEEQQSYLLGHLIASLGMIMFILVVPEKIRWWVFGFFTIGVVVDAFTGVPKIIKVTRQLWAARLGYLGERAVAEELNALLVKGYRVFHDLPFEKFNIDHVIVGPKGLFIVETKTRRKPKQKAEGKEYKVIQQGRTLHWPSASETKTIDQALLNAKTMSEWVASSAGETAPAQAIVAVPGWWTERDTNFSAAWVLNPRGIKSFVEKHDQALSADQIQRIAFQLEQRCRLKKD